MVCDGVVTHTFEAGPLRDVGDFDSFTYVYYGEGLGCCLEGA
jgi:hypothetical protein